MEFKKVYFLGIGGIGMSALARYFRHEGMAVAGYDRTPSALTLQLEQEGISITFDEGVATIPAPYRDPSDTLVVYTPAIAEDHPQRLFFRQQGFEMLKRSRMLGIISEAKYVMAVAGTHGKTTTTTLTAWFNHVAGGGGSAFLGGISKNFESNLLLGEGDRLAVEADEFDRSFLQLHPDVALITAVDPDHLDIYGTPEAFREAFLAFLGQIRPGGAAILRQGVELEVQRNDIQLYHYALNTPADFWAQNIEPTSGGCYRFDWVYPGGVLKGCQLGIPGIINLENAVGAAAMIWVAGQSGDSRSGPSFDPEGLREAISTFSGVRRRFDCYINTPERIYMDDYAHHPKELEAAITSFRAMFPGRRMSVIFQPHLYTRTRDFFGEFARALSLADEVLLLPIYPAREEPIEGITSEMMIRHITVPARVVQKADLLETLRRERPDALVTFGAGDIDRFCQPIAQLLRSLDAPHS